MKRISHQDIAEAAQQSPSTVRSVLSLKDSSTRDVALYVTRVLTANSAPLEHAEIDVLFGDQVEQWNRRWPRFDLYHCGVRGCHQILVAPGLCTAHGGPSRPTVTIREDHFMVWVGRQYEPICRLILGCPRDLKVCHCDGNPWNSHHDNLMVEGWPTGAIPSRRKRWTYDYAKLATALETSEDNVRQLVSRGAFDPGSLESICHFLSRSMKAAAL